MKALKIGALVMSALLLVMVLMMAYLFMTAEVTAWFPRWACPPRSRKGTSLR